MTSQSLRSGGESERATYWRELTAHLPNLPDPQGEKWCWSEEDIRMLRAACAKRFDESLRTESLFAIAATGIRIYLARLAHES